MLTAKRFQDEDLPSRSVTVTAGCLFRRWACETDRASWAQSPIQRQENDVTTAGRGTRPIKEAFFVQIQTSDEKFVFFDETNKLGRKMPYDKPEATCGMRATQGAVSFSLLKHTNRSRLQAVEQRLELPRGPLDRAERRAETLGRDLPKDMIAVEVGDAPAIHLTISRDENGMTTLGPVPDAEDEGTLTLPKRGLALTIVMHAPRGSKVISAGFIGYVGKPESTETVTRVTAIALNTLANLSTFRLVSGIEGVVVPPSPARYLAARPVLKAADRARTSVPVRLWTPTNELVAAFPLAIELDLEQANPISGRPLFHLTPPDEHKETFQPYSGLVADAALSLVTQHLSHAEVEELVYSIALGELTPGDIGRLRDAVASISGLDVSPAQWAPYAAPPVA